MGSIKGWNAVGAAASLRLHREKSLLLPAWRWDAAGQRMQPVRESDLVPPGTGFFILARKATTLPADL
jgi:hypothetical protein